MNKKITSSVLAALMIAGSTSFTALASMSNGTVVIGDQAFDLKYANDLVNVDEITNAVVAGGEVYVKDFNGIWISNLTGETVDANIIPAVVYKSVDEEINYDSMDRDQVTTITVESANAIKDVNVDYGTEVANVVLPEKVTLELNNNTIKDVDVNWTSIDYDETKTGAYIFTGAYVLPEGVTGTKPTVSVNVVVGVNPDLADIDVAKVAVTTLQSAADKDLTVEANLTDAEALVQPAKDATAKVDDVTEKESLTAKVVAAEKIVTDAKVVFEAVKLEKAAEDAAEVAVATAETSRKIVDITTANAKVEAVKDATKKAEFIERITNIDVLVNVSFVSLNKTTDSLTVGGTDNLIATLDPVEATNKNVKWTSSDNNIATVDINGKVTAISAGTATVTITTEDQSKTATCNIIVQSVNNGLELNKPYIAKDGLTVTVTNIQNIEEVGSMKYIVSYTLKNETTDKKIGEATFKMYFEDGTNLPQYGFFGSLFPAQSISRIYTFEVLKTQKPTIIEYGADFFATKPSLDTLKWEISK